MASNSFGQIFRITTWGEPYSKAMGVVIDGCPSNLKLSEEDIVKELKKRAPNKNAYATRRKEKDIPLILSGIWKGKTTGSPISILIPNQDFSNQDWKEYANFYRPSHGSYTYKKKYSHFDPRGAGRASGRETVCRVAAGAIAKKILKEVFSIEIIAYLSSVGPLVSEEMSFEEICKNISKSYYFWADKKKERELEKYLKEIKTKKSSVGGCVSFLVQNVIASLGDPVYEKLSSNLAKALLSIPGAKGFEYGRGFAAAAMRGEEHNDLFKKQKRKIVPKTNNAGGMLAGISTGLPIYGKIGFKPTPTFAQEQKTYSYEGKKSIWKVKNKDRYDICIAIRACPVVEAMIALVLVDAVLMNKRTNIEDLLCNRN